MNSKRLRAFCIGIAGLALIQTPGFAQSGQTVKLHCHNVGYSPQQPLGDRKGHAISVSDYTCRVEGGLADGAVVTGTTIWEWHKTNAVELSGIGVGRKPGAIYTYQHTKGKGALIISDGKVTGFAGSGRGRFTMATGATAEYKGKTFSFTFKTLGAGLFEVEVVIE
jgi:hypothetical protein